MHIPLGFALLLDNGSLASASSVKGGDVTGEVLHLTQRAQTFTFGGIGSRPVLSLNRGFSAPSICTSSNRAQTSCTSFATSRISSPAGRLLPIWRCRC